MNWKHYLLLLLVFPLMQSRCKKETEEELEGQLRLVPRALFNGNDFEIGESYTDILVHTIRVDGFKTYIA